MTDAERIASELDAVFAGTPWHADALMTILEGVRADQVAWRPAEGIHTIEELVDHLTFWKRVILDRLAGDPVSDADRRDWDAGRGSGGWSQRLARLRKAHEALLKRVRALTPAELDAIVPGKTIPARDMLYGASYHDAYHAGQIRLVERLHEEVN